MDGGLDQPVEITEYSDINGLLYDQSGNPVKADTLSQILDGIEKKVKVEKGCVNIGYLAEDEHLVVRVEAPDDKTIEVIAGEFGQIKMCARDPLVKSVYVAPSVYDHVGAWHTIQMQIQPN